MWRRFFLIAWLAVTAFISMNALPQLEVRAGARLVPMLADRQQETRFALLEGLLKDLKAAPGVRQAADFKGTRRALIIGNDDYKHLPELKKAVGDANSIKTTLEGLKFKVTVETNVDRLTFHRVLKKFYATVDAGDTALLFYAGHGVAYEGRNYLLPVDTPKLDSEETEADIPHLAIHANEIVSAIDGRNVEMALVILDACRDNPFALSGTRAARNPVGLVPIEPNKGIFVLYSAGEGEKALDRLSDFDPEPTSVFTRKFLPILSTPGLPLLDIAKRTQIEVQELAKKVPHTQVPAYYDRVPGQFYFQPPRPRLFGLTIGIDGEFNQNVHGAINDAEDVSRSLEALGAQKVMRLFGQDARLRFIDYVWRDMIEDARAGDTIVFSYSGSAFALEDLSGDETGGQDHLLALSGLSQETPPDPRKVGLMQAISDDQLTEWMQLASDKNVNVVLLIDGCHAGGMLDRPFANVAFLGASSKEESVAEYAINGRMHAATSVAFADAIEGAADYNGDGFVSQRELFHYVSKYVLDVTGHQTPEFMPPLFARDEIGGTATDLPLFTLPADIEERKAQFDHPWPGEVQPPVAR